MALNMGTVGFQFLEAGVRNPGPWNPGAYHLGVAVKGCVQNGACKRRQVHVSGEHFATATASLLRSNLSPQHQTYCMRSKATGSCATSKEAFNAGNSFWTCGVHLASVAKLPQS